MTQTYTTLLRFISQSGIQLYQDGHSDNTHIDMKMQNNARYAMQILSPPTGENYVEAIS